MPKPDRRSAEAAAYRRLYKTARWRAKRLAQLEAEPLCRRCKKRGRIVPATVANHLIAHKGDLDLFWYGELESSCKPCHDGDIQSEERLGYSKEIGADGFPVDPNHPWNAATR